MDRAQAIVRYDGPAVSDHQMDVHDLAPSLLALGDLCKLANEILNGQSATVRMLVRADLEHKCFQLQIELFQTLYEQLTAILDMDGVKNAKNILEWIGIIGVPAGIVGGTLFELLKFLRAAPRTQPSAPDAPLQERAIEIKSGSGSVIYQIVGDGNSISVSPEVHKLAEDPRTLPTVKKLLAPLRNEGYDKLEFEVNGKVTQYFTQDQVREIMRGPDNLVFTVLDGRQLISTIRTAVRVKKAMFEGSAKWGIVYKRPVEAKIADVEWLGSYQAGQIVLGPRWRLVVDLEERVPVDDEGVETGEAVYTIIKVHGVEPPPQQIKLM